MRRPRYMMRRDYVRRPLLRISSSLLSTLYFQMGFDWEKERYSFVIQWEIDISINSKNAATAIFSGLLKTYLAYAFSNKAGQKGDIVWAWMKTKRLFTTGNRSSMSTSVHSPHHHMRNLKNE